MAKKCARTFSIVVEKGKKSILDVTHLLPDALPRSVHEHAQGWDNVNPWSGKHHTHLVTKTWLPDALLRSCPSPRARSARGAGCPTPSCGR